MTSAAQGDPPSGARVPWYQNPWVWGVLFGLVFIPLIRPLTRRVPAPPPVLGALPAFELVDESGEPFTREDMAGDVWVVGFFFTECRTLCPRILAATTSLAARYERNEVPVRMLLVSVDPTTDTPAVLKAKAEEMGLDLDRWSLVTGPEPEVRALVEGGFQTAMGRQIVDEATGIVDIAHTERLILVDWQGALRGYYGIDELGLDEVYHRSTHVLRQLNQGGEASKSPGS